VLELSGPFCATAGWNGLPELAGSTPPLPVSLGSVLDLATCRIDLSHTLSVGTETDVRGLPNHSSIRV
jgi:hypothetical protein